jgi:hypothetical protein
VHLLERELQLDERRPVDHGSKLDLVGPPLESAFQHLPFGVGVRVAETDAQQKAV